MSTFGPQKFVVSVTRPALLDGVRRGVYTAPLRVFDATSNGYREFERTVECNGDTFEVNFMADGRDAASMLGKFQDSLNNGVDGIKVSYQSPVKALSAA